MCGVRGPSFQAGPLGGGLNTYLGLGNVHTRGHVFHLTLCATLVCCGEFPGVGLHRVSPYHMPQCPHYERELWWLNTLTFQILGQACSSGHTTCCEGH